MTNKRLVWYLEKKKKIDDRQFDFKKQEKTERRHLNNKKKLEYREE